MANCLTTFASDPRIKQKSAAEMKAEQDDIMREQEAMMLAKYGAWRGAYLFKTASHLMQIYTMIHSRFVLAFVL